ncbi:SseB family protein [Leucobacter denitrificans]|uniref:SseB family protein n=1 Tax=Leucobacter denitrificans TaxID=683042 RepID=A0A7G9S262_9MICO|nr:SseB family protein [Leucobacter denitrificans]QNN61937.1 SseB family protein [Leucobacter denitrificans]
MNLTERAILAARGGDIELPVLIATILESNLLVPAHESYIAGKVDFCPLLTSRNGESYVVAFTHSKEIEKAGVETQYVASFIGSQLFRAIPAGTGLMINGGSDDSFALNGESVANIVAAMPNH